MSLGRRAAQDAQWMKQPFHPYTFIPDLPPDTQGGISDAQGLYPTSNGLRVQRVLLVRTTGITGGPTQGWFNGIFPNGSNFVYVGTATHLWSASGTTFVENDNSQTYTGLTNPWTFAQVASTVAATNGVDPVQAVTISGGQFAALGGSPPVAKIVSSADPGGTGYFLFLFNLASDKQGWACSGAGLPASWPLDTTNLSATGTLGVTQGPVTAAAPLRGGICAFKANSFYYGQFIGTPYVWQFQLVSPSQGVYGPYAVASAGDALYFIGNDNIYSFDGFSLAPIPNKLAQWLFSQSLDINYATKTIGAYDSANDIVSFQYASRTANPRGTLDTRLMWHRKSGRWCIDHIVIQGEAQVNLPTISGTTYGQMTTTYPLYGSITPGTTYGMLASPSSVSTSHAVFLGDNNLYTFSGLPRQLNTFFITNDIGTPERQTSIYRSRLSWSIFPINGNMQIIGLGKDIDGQSATQISALTSMGPRGFFDFRQTARWNDLKYYVTGDAEITGHEELITDGGWR